MIVFLWPQVSNAAVLFLSPSSGNYSSGDQITVYARINTEGSSINAVDGTIGFDSNLLEVNKISKGSAINLWVQEPSYSNKTGSVNFGGVVLNPGFSGSNGQIVTIVFKAKGNGQANINFKAGSVLANDGYGTNVLKAMNGSSFYIGDGTQAPAAIAGFELSSSTHPDQIKWYPNNDPVFQIKFPADAKELNLVLSRNEQSTPQIKYAPPVSEKILEDVDEGIWYLHANYRGKAGLSPTIRYRFQIDTGLPENLKIIRIDPGDTINPSPKYELRADDLMSGIGRYEAKIDGDEWVKLERDAFGYYSLPPQIPGQKLLAVRAFDNAGNFIESFQELRIEVPAKPAWRLSLRPLLIALAKVFDTIINFIANRWNLLIILIAAGTVISQTFIKGIPYFAAEIKKIRFIASEYKALKNLKKLDSKTRIELKIIEKDIKKELELLVKISSHRQLHPDEQYLKNKLLKYIALLKSLK